MASVRAGANRSVSVVISRFKVESWAGAGKFVMAWIPVQFLLDGFSELPLMAGMLGFPWRGLLMRAIAGLAALRSQLRQVAGQSSLVASFPALAVQ